MSNKIRFADLTEEQKKVICNGCGGKGSFFRPPRSAVYEEMCNHHDFNYSLGGGWKDKLKADWQLCWEIWKHGWNYGELSDGLWGLIYFLGISIGGGSYFNFDGDGETLDITEFGFEKE